MRKNPNNPVHVRVEDPKDLRRSILQTEAECIKVLQSGKYAYDKLNSKNLERKEIF